MEVSLTNYSKKLYLTKLPFSNNSASNDFEIFDWLDNLDIN